jgi:Ca-activated chloride channel family protein
MLEFVYPLCVLLLPMPWLIARILPPRRQQLVAVHVPFLDRIAELTGAKSDQGESTISFSGSQLALNGLLWILILLAMARPQWLEQPLVKAVPMRDLLIAIDLSGSMETEDFSDAEGKTVDRLTAVQQVLQEFLKRREDDRIGLVVFGSAAFVQVPFTEDNGVVAQLLEETTVRMAGPRTMLGDAMGLAITLFDRSEIDDRMMIVLTDGNDTGSQIPPQRAAEIARDKEVVIHTIGVGDPTAANEEALDEAALREIAMTTGGNYYHANDRGELESIYTELDKLAPRKVETLSYRPQQDLFAWPLAAALVLSLFYHGLAAMSRLWRQRADRSAEVDEVDGDVAGASG